jgi:hypothetical protein
MRISRISWYRWGKRLARGRTRYAYANDCNPYCARGTFRRYRVRLVLHRVRTCSADGELIFTRMTVIFLGRKWDGPRKFTQRLLCEPAGGSRAGGRGIATGRHIERARYLPA